MSSSLVPSASDINEMDAVNESIVPPTYEDLAARYVERIGSCSDAEENRLWLIDELNNATRKSVACGQVFPHSCRSCKTESPTQRVICSNFSCCHVFCSDCAIEGSPCPSCSSSTHFIRLFEEESRECPICITIPFWRSVFTGCGHIICGACALELVSHEGKNCPLCREKSEVQTMLEEVVNPSD